MDTLGAFSVPAMTLEHLTCIFSSSLHKTNLEEALPLADRETEDQIEEVLPKVILLSHIQRLFYLDP